MVDIREEVLVCPDCGRRHLDVGEWKTRPHHKHLCHYCGHIWRLEDYVAGSILGSTGASILEAHAHNRGYKAAAKRYGVELKVKFPPNHCDWADRNDGSDYCALGDALREQLEVHGEKFLLWSVENNAWHRKNNCGYTVHSSAAGLYSKEDAMFASHMCRDGWHKDDHRPQELAIPLSCIPEEFRPNG